MVQSMTGFAVQTRDLGSVSLHLELRSVNSRYLDLGFRIVDDLRAAEPAIRKATASEDFPAAMAAIAGLRAPIDAFFDAVQVNTDSQITRRNRLNLLHRIRALVAQVADLTRVEG